MRKAARTPCRPRSADGARIAPGLAAPLAFEFQNAVDGAARWERWGRHGDDGDEHEEQLHALLPGEDAVRLRVYLPAATEGSSLCGGPYVTEGGGGVRIHACLDNTA